MLRLTKFIALALASTLVVTAAEARGKKEAPTAPGTYKAWGEDIDTVEVLKTFSMGDYDTVAVMPFDTSGTPTPDKSEKAYKSVKDVLDSYTETLTEALRDEMKGKAKVSMVAEKPSKSKTLIVRGKVEAIDPGSRAKRYFGGFGAGAGANRMSGELVDAKSGAVLLRFTQERRSAGAWKLAGGSDVQVMRDSIHAMGQDIAHILNEFK